VSGNRRDFASVGVFGSELLPPTSVIETVTAITVGFKTEQAAVRELVPYHFEPVPDPVMRVNHLTYTGMDYLAGRGYNVVSVSVPVTFTGKQVVTGSFNIVVWEGLSHAVNLGRELQGYAKIYGEVPDSTATENGHTFQCCEYGTPLVQGEVHDLVEYTPEQLAKLQDAAKSGYSLGWKYIPGPKLSTEPDCDYATRISNPAFYDAAWTATGSVEFCDATWEQAPVSKRVLDRLRDLPMLGFSRAFIGKGSASAPRGTVERLLPSD
jgi:acetoacetate decarboxylase